MLDAETKQLFADVKVALAEQNKFRGALAQLEEQLANVPKTIDNKLAAIRRTAWDDRGNYRGVFETEDDARCFGLYVMAHVGHDARAAEALNGEMKSVYERAMGSDTTAAGGAAVPVEYSRRIERLVEAFGVWAANAFPMPMSSDSLTFSRRTSGLTVFKTGQNVATTASDLGFATINLNADEWNVLALYPKSLDADAAGAIGELVALEIALAFANQLDSCGFIGDGTPTYLDVFGIIPRLITINVSVR